MEPRLLILETSHRAGIIALAIGQSMVAERAIDDQRRHARDLAPAVQDLLRSQGWRARELDGVIVSKGPGSYTGLRVGLTSAKTLAYATGCALIAVNTFDAIAAQCSQDVDVIADAQQGNLYVQRFGSHPEALRIVPWDEWLASALASGISVTGPGLDTFASRVPSELNTLPRELWFARPVSLLALGWERFRLGQRDDPFAVEPLYLRASSAELKWDQLHPKTI